MRLSNGFSAVRSKQSSTACCAPGNAHSHRVSRCRERTDGGTYRVRKCSRNRVLARPLHEYHFVHRISRPGDHLPHFLYRRIGPFDPLRSLFAHETTSTAGSGSSSLRTYRRGTRCAWCNRESGERGQPVSYKTTLRDELVRTVLNLSRRWKD